MLTGVYGSPERPSLKRYFPVEGSENFHPKYTKKIGDSTYHIVPPFSFTNQDGETFTEKDVEDHIYVTDFFFTRCPGRCPKLTFQLKRVQEQFRGDTTLMILSHSVDPDYDQPDVLTRYAKNLGCDWESWNFLTGPEEDINSIAKEGYYITAIPGGGAERTDHSGKFVLVDKDRVIRGYYEGTDSVAVNKMMYDIKVLELEYVGHKRFKQFDYRPPKKKIELNAR